MLGHYCRYQLALATLGERNRQVLLDGNVLTVLISGVIHNAEATDRNLLYNPVSAKFQTFGQSCVVLSGHPM